MKKLAIVLLSVMLVMAFAFSAFALHGTKAYEYAPSVVKSGKSQIELGGELRVRGDYAKNLDFFEEVSDTSAKYDERARLSVKATLSPNTMGFIELETGSSGDTYTWGNNTSGINGTKPTSLYLRQGYISHQFGSGMGVKAGHMLAALGNGLFFDHTKFGDDGIVLWMSPAEGTELSFTTLKFKEGGATANSDDDDAYILGAESSMGGVKLSGDVTYVRERESSNATTAYQKGLNLWNVGVRGSSDVAGVKVRGDVEIQRGNLKDNDTSDDVKFKGYAVLLGVDAKAGDVNVTVEGAYGSGDKIDSDDKYEGFVNYLSDQQKFTYIYDYRVAGAVDAASKNTGLANTMYLKAGASSKVTPDLKVGGDLYYLRAAKKIDDADDLDSKKIGVELDAKVEYQIDTNLVYYIEAGYLWAGDLYKNAAAVGADEDPDNPYSVRHGVILKF